eukprot:CAMPEP_0114250778 /NCGR_PEP_ID=MMETSP0058-20121206/14888_1 /TAXON_ID=36894 /ORGANISM="Pyramimonas parkeae, CCMP726" /LENGTH=460 /DNA_ID=CAMNT_0001364475 /DNA_START=158 /DNA_END=1541 /DNA_ORIENTATION=+
MQQRRSTILMSQNTNRTNIPSTIISEGAGDLAAPFYTTPESENGNHSLEDLLGKVAAGKLEPGAAAEQVLKASAAAALEASTLSLGGSKTTKASRRVDILNMMDIREVPPDAQPRQYYFPDPESDQVVWAPGKTVNEIADLMKQKVSKGRVCMATRVSPEVYQGIQRLMPEARYHAKARICTLGGVPRGLDEWGTDVSRHLPGHVTVITANTGDLPVAEEVMVTLDVMGCTVHMMVDMGVEALTRMVNEEICRASDVVIVVAGMDGALPSVVAGLVECPVVSVPTSAGYGKSFEGYAPLLSAFTACSAGVAVVNNDNGFGAAMLATRMLRQSHKAHERELSRMLPPRPNPATTVVPVLHYLPESANPNEETAKLSHVHNSAVEVAQASALWEREADQWTQVGASGATPGRNNGATISTSPGAYRFDRIAAVTKRLQKRSSQMQDMAKEMQDRHMQEFFKQ